MCIEAIKLSKEPWVYVAKPLRAITDFIYLRKEISWETDGLEFLTESMRMEKEDISQIDFSQYNDILDGLHNKRTIHYLEEMKKELQR